jgi:hypothetical protein
MKSVLVTVSVATLLIAIALNYFATKPPNPASRTQLSNPSCKLRFGTKRNQEVLISISNGSFLIYRNQDSVSTPESYPLSNGGLISDGDLIPPFEFDDTTYTILECYEYEVDDPSPMHRIMVHVKVEHAESTLVKFCDAELAFDEDVLSIADFHAPLNIGLQTFNFVPDDIVFQIGGEPIHVRVCVGAVDKEIGSWVMVDTSDASEDPNKCGFHPDVRPTMTVYFPAGGGTTITKTYILDQFC